MTLFILAGIVLFVVAVIKPFYVVPVFIAGAYIEPSQYFPYLVQYNPLVIMGGLVILGWLLHLLAFGDFTPAKSKQVKAAGLFVLWAVCSTLIHKENSHYFMVFARVIIPYFLFVYMIKTRRNLSSVVWILLIVGAVVAIYSVYQFKANIGIYDRGVKRIAGFFDNPNSLGQSLMTIVPFALGMLLSKRSLASRGIILGILAFLVAGIVISYSRSSFIGFIAGVFLFVFRFFKKEKKVAACIATVFCLLMATYFFPSHAKYTLWSRLRRVIRADSLEQVDSGRVETNKAGIKMMFENPLLGVGLGGFTPEYIRLASISPDIRVVSRHALVPHNLYIQVGSYLGLAGLGLFLFLVILVLKDLRYSERLFLSHKDDFLRIMAISTQVYVFVFLIVGMFSNSLYSKTFWMIIALSVVLRRIACDIEEKKRNKSRKKSVQNNFEISTEYVQ